MGALTFGETGSNALFKVIDGTVRARRFLMRTHIALMVITEVSGMSGILLTPNDDGFDVAPDGVATFMGRAIKMDLYSRWSIMTRVNSIP